MHIRRIDLDDEGMPATVTVEMSRSEALYVAKLTGKQNGITSEEVMPGGSDANGEVYGALVGELFNRYYDDGISDPDARG